MDLSLPTAVVETVAGESRRFDQEETQATDGAYARRLERPATGVYRRGRRWVMAGLSLPARNTP
ncbi:MAG: hypothetical protein JRH10_20450 [Deltaproteobacteria bacterium]|nr:hypothetical protein [Deltaproteobacteria bacterium]